MLKSLFFTAAFFLLLFVLEGRSAASVGTFFGVVPSIWLGVGLDPRALQLVFEAKPRS